MIKQKTKTLLTVSLICCLTVLTACTNKNKERQALFIKDVEQRAELGMNAMRFELDADGDGVLTCIDADLLKTRLMECFDVDEDPSLSPKEYQEVRLAERRFVYFEFDMVDKDKNKSISQSEFSAIPNDRLKSLDLNNNCEISDNELKKGMIAKILQDRNSVNSGPKKNKPQLRRGGRKGQGGRRGNQGNLNL